MWTRPVLRAAVAILLFGVSLSSVDARGTPPLGALIALEGAFASHPLPPGAPIAVAHLPSDLPSDPKDVDVVLFLHGWRGCARVLAEAGPTRCRDAERPAIGWGLAERHAASRSSAILLIPQLAYRTRDGSPGRFAEAGFTRRFLRASLERIASERGWKRRPRLRTLTVIAHSAGYRTALAILERGEVASELRSLVLMDALYDAEDTFADWLVRSPRHRLLAIHTGRGEPEGRTKRLATRVKKLLGDPRVRSVRGHLESPHTSARLTVLHSPHPHGAIPARHLREVLELFAEESP